SSLHRGNCQQSAGFVRERMPFHCGGVGIGNRRAIQFHPARRTGVHHVRSQGGRASPIAWSEAHPGPAVGPDCAQAGCVRKVKLAWHTEKSREAYGGKVSAAGEIGWLEQKESSPRQLQDGSLALTLAREIKIQWNGVRLGIFFNVEIPFLLAEPQES